MRQTRQSGSMRGVWKQGPRYGCSDTARRKGRKRIRRTYSSLRHTPTLPLKPLRAGMPGDFGVLVVTRVRSTNTKCTRDRGCIVRPAFPTPSLGEGFLQKLGRLAPRGRSRIRNSLNVIASEAKQSILSLRGKMDCFAALAMTVRWTEGLGQCAQTIGHSV